jgi:hypothetical protein
MSTATVVTFSLHAPDLRAALRSAAVRRPWFWLCVSLLALLAVLVALGAGAAPAHQSISALGTVISCTAVYLSFVLVFGPYLRARRAAQWGVQQSWILDATGLRWQIRAADAERLSEGQLHWQAITRLVETPSGLLFYVGRSAVAFLPASSLVDGDLRERALALAGAAPTVRIDRSRGHAPVRLGGATVALVMVAAISASVIEANSRAGTARLGETAVAACLQGAGNAQGKLQACLRLPGALPPGTARERSRLARSLANASKLAACLQTAGNDLDKLQRCATLVGVR